MKACIKLVMMCLLLFLCNARIHKKLRNGNGGIPRYDCRPFISSIEITANDFEGLASCKAAGRPHPTVFVGAQGDEEMIVPNTTQSRRSSLGTTIAELIFPWTPSEELTFWCSAVNIWGTSSFKFSYEMNSSNHDLGTSTNTSTNASSKDLIHVSIITGALVGTGSVIIILLLSFFYMYEVKAIRRHTRCDALLSRELDTLHESYAETSFTERL